MAEIPELDLCARLLAHGRYWVPEDIANQASRTRQQQIDELIVELAKLQRKADMAYAHGARDESADALAKERDEAVALLRETRDKHDTEAWSRAEAFLARYPEKKPQGQKLRRKGEGKDQP